VSKMPVWFEETKDFGTAQSDKSDQGMIPFLIFHSRRQVIAFWCASFGDRTSEHDRDEEVGRAWR